ncbi:hypothetical protein OROHE_001650 [Orobanche hederae]
MYNNNAPVSQPRVGAWNVDSSDSSGIQNGAQQQPTQKAHEALASGDSSKLVHLQFGSISPGIMNGMQILARTNSAPPNLDEQKREQARYESSRTGPAVPTPSKWRKKDPPPRSLSVGKAKASRPSRLKAEHPVSSLSSSPHPNSGL